MNKCRLHTVQIINSFKIRTWNNTIIHACANYVNVSLNEVKKCYWIDKHIYQVPNPYSLPQFWGRIGSFGGKTNNSATLGELIGPQKLSSGSDSIVFEIWIFFNPSLPVNEPINHQRSAKRPSGYVRETLSSPDGLRSIFPPEILTEELESLLVKSWTYNPYVLLIQGMPHWYVSFIFSLTDRNMQVKLFLKVVLGCRD